ncbi:MAG TPA: GTPase HflX [Gemmatimonadaceae bacterium]|nr:GTPase HflX [Gemmatimonadaceae bacterium]
MARDLIELSSPTERVLLVGAPLKRSGGAGVSAGARGRTMDEHLEELEQLVDTAGGKVVGTLTQQLDRPNPATYLGKGKIQELTHRVTESGATLIVFDDELTPAQGKNVEDATGRRVMDRAELILDIFATRARSNEAKLQVELAQLQYMLPRLTRMWAHLERFKGGIGMRGPGETQLETDRRLINQRIKTLRQRLEEVERTREVQRSGRRDTFRASLVGYTNAGKSSVLRGLSGSPDVFVEDRLFATLDPLTRDVDIGENYPVVLTDTVGFIRKLPHDLVASFRATLSEVREADQLLHVIDANHPQWEEQLAVVNEVLVEIEAHDKPVIHVFNKIDQLTPEELVALQDRVREEMPSAVFVSAWAENGLEPLRRSLLGCLRRQRPIVEIRMPASDGRLLAEVHREGEVVEQTHDGEELVLRARVGRGLVAKLRSQGLAVSGAADVW